MYLQLVCGEPSSLTQVSPLPQTAASCMVVLARQNGQLKKEEIKKWKKDFQKPISD
jgi:hypothetical protein